MTSDGLGQFDIDKLEEQYGKHNVKKGFNKTHKPGEWKYEITIRNRNGEKIIRYKLYDKTAELTTSCGVS